MSNPAHRHRERVLQQMQVAVRARDPHPDRRRDCLRRLLIRQLFVAFGGPHQIDEALRQDRAQPRGEAAPAVEVAKQGLTIGPGLATPTGRRRSESTSSLYTPQVGSIASAVR